MTDKTIERVNVEMLVGGHNHRRKVLAKGAVINVTTDQADRLIGAKKGQKTDKEPT